MNKESNKIRNRFNRILDVVLVVGSIIALAVAGVLFYQRVYLTPFYVNGQSMYPTLNSNATSPDGTLLGKTGGSAYNGVTRIDYGVMDTHKSAIDKIERFDIVVTHYPNHSLDNTYIKRVIGLPGETISFATNVSDSHYGDLYVKNGDQMTFVQQPITDEYKSNITNSSLRYPVGDIVLADNEYYVLGDNRNNSSDSRSVGKITRDLLVGKVIALVGYCDLANGNPTNVVYKWPEFIK